MREGPLNSLESELECPEDRTVTLNFGKSELIQNDCRATFLSRSILCSLEIREREANVNWLAALILFTLRVTVTLDDVEDFIGDVLGCIFKTTLSRAELFGLLHEVWIVP
jgi:hypothetical protein